MHNERKINESLYYVGGSDRRLSLFENSYPIPDGVSYNSYLYLDERTCLLDTVDTSVSELFYENIAYVLGERKLDYLIVSHLEPDHSFAIKRLLEMHPELTIVTSALGQKFLLNFFPKIEAKFLLIKDGDLLSIGAHRFHFVSAPLIHWPEVTFAYEEKDKILFSADAFGTFGALNGNLYCRMDKYKEEHLDEARRYYTNIVGKFGDAVNKVLTKAAALDIEMIAPLHGPLLKGNLDVLLNAYKKWASYEPEEDDRVLLVYASIYGNTANAVDVLSSKLNQKGVSNLAIFDVSKTDMSYLLAESFRAHTIVIASSTIDGECYNKIGEYLRCLKSHNLQKRSFAIIESGSWAPKAKADIANIVSEMKDTKILLSSVSFLSTLKEEQLSSLDSLSAEIADDIKKSEEPSISIRKALSSPLLSLFSISKDEIDDVSIVDTFFPINEEGDKFALALPRSSKSLSNILETGKANISLLTLDTPFPFLKRLGDGESLIKEDPSSFSRSKNGLLRLSVNSNSYLSLSVNSSFDYGDGLLFILTLEEEKVLNNKPALTKDCYFIEKKEE